MQDCARDAIDAWLPPKRESLLASEVRLDVAEEMSDLTLEIVAAAAFGSRLSHSKELKHVSQQMMSIVDIVQHHFQSGLAFLPGANWVLSKLSRPVRKYHSAGRTFLTAILHKRREEQGTAPLMDVLAANEAVDAKEALSNSLAFMLAGHETTANSLCWVLYLLDRHPEWWDALREEVFAVCGSEEPPNMSQALRELPVCAAIFSETLRLFPVLSQLSRCVLSPLEVSCGGKRITLPVGTPLLASIAAGQRNPAFWDAPMKFDPTRFLSPRLPLKHPAAHAPFSLGRRNCIGKYFAQLEARIIIATLAQRVKLKISPTYRHHPFMAITLRPRYGMPMDVRRLTPVEVKDWEERVSKNAALRNRRKSCTSAEGSEPMSPAISGRTAAAAAARTVGVVSNRKRAVVAPNVSPRSTGSSAGFAT
jgi:cytokinin trans-hydroxylase